MKSEASFLRWRPEMCCACSLVQYKSICFGGFAPFDSKMWYDTSWCAVIWFDVIWCNVRWWHDVMCCNMLWCDVIWYAVMQCDLMWCEVMRWDVMWSDILWYDVMSYQVWWCRAWLDNTTCLVISQETTQSTSMYNFHCAEFIIVGQPTTFFAKRRSLGHVCFPNIKDNASLPQIFSTRSIIVPLFA